MLLRGRFERERRPNLLPSLLPCESTLLGDDLALPAAACHALLIELAAFGMAARVVAHALNAIAMADLQPFRTGHRLGRPTEREQQRSTRSHRHTPA
jgi:hypothetical protein